MSQIGPNVLPRVRLPTHHRAGARRPSLHPARTRRYFARFRLARPGPGRPPPPAPFPPPAVSAPIRQKPRHDVHRLQERGVVLRGARRAHGKLPDQLSEIGVHIADPAERECFQLLQRSAVRELDQHLRGHGVGPHRTVGVMTADEAFHVAERVLTAQQHHSRVLGEGSSDRSAVLELFRFAQRGQLLETEGMRVQSQAVDHHLRLSNNELIVPQYFQGGVKGFGHCECPHRIEIFFSRVDRLDLR
mmetsp:Transcript_28563/g.59705  ORF Transcript_28563/g.59705 Transcript_28563/m.59705 type:complete len:246 (+) Transcript_28563:794-1531(+)